MACGVQADDSLASDQWPVLNIEDSIDIEVWTASGQLASSSVVSPAVSPVACVLNAQAKSGPVPPALTLPD